MAHRLLKGYPRTMANRSQEVTQRFEYLLVMDFEATCERDTALKPQEIIELPCAAVSTCDWKLKDMFHAYVRPRVHPVLTPFCTDLTGIMQETVHHQPYFTDVFTTFSEWLTKRGYFDKPDKSAFVTCGSWDLKIMLPAQCDLDGIAIPEQFKQWIDLKHTFCESTGYFPRSLKDMLVRLNLPLQGRLHSGIDDVKNMVAIIRALQDMHNAQFKITSSLKSPGLNMRAKQHDSRDCEDAKEEDVVN